MDIKMPSPEKMDATLGAWIPVEQAYREDPGFRRRLAEDAGAAVAEKGLQLPEGISEVRVAENTAETFHVIFPRDPNASLGDDALQNVSGGAVRPGTSHFDIDPGSGLPYGPRYSGYTPGAGGM